MPLVRTLERSRGSDTKKSSARAIDTIEVSSVIRATPGVSAWSAERPSPASCASMRNVWTSRGPRRGDDEHD